MAAGDRTEKLLAGFIILDTLSNGGTVIVNPPMSVDTIIKQVIITNTDTVDRTFTLSLINQSPDSHIFSNMPIGANDTIVWDTAFVLHGDTPLWGHADTGGKVNVWVTGWEKQL